MMLKFIDGLGDWNHALIVGIGIWPLAGLLWLLGLYFKTPFVVAMFASLLIWTAFYYGKEHGIYRVSGFSLIDSLNLILWEGHDRRQTIYLFFVGLFEVGAVLWFYLRSL